GTAAFTCLAFNPVNGKPYVAFMDMINSNKASVMKFDDAQWIDVGAPDFSPGEGWFVKIAFSTSGIPFVIFQDYAVTGDVTVMKFDGFNWVNVGPAGFVSNVTDEAGFGVSPMDGQPYVAVDDAANFHRVKVMKFDGSNWVTVGDIGSTQGWSSRRCITFSPLGQLYVSYWDSSFPGMCVKTFDGTNWKTIGNTGFSAGYLNYPSFHLSPSGAPCLAYMDEADSSRATMMKYDFSIGIDQIQENGFRLYPNPATNHITLEFKKNDISLKNIEVCDINGKMMVASLTSNDKVTINTEDFTSGIYMVKVKTENAVYVARFCQK
ncbi:MAG: T9SS type A sorting domain-containing protein, partial [Bacteroidota bacterium]